MKNDCIAVLQKQGIAFRRILGGENDQYYYTGVPG